MTQYIDKDALVAEIDNIESSAVCEYKSQPSRYNEGCLDSIHRIKSFLNTLEVKEVDLEKATEKNLWKPADGDDLPDIDREVIALLDNGKVVFAHRPPEYWDGKNIITGKVTRNYPKTYDKGGWNIPDVKYWLDVRLPKEIEL